MGSNHSNHLSSIRNKIQFIHNNKNILIKKKFKNLKDLKNELFILRRANNISNILHPITYNISDLYIIFPYITCDLFQYKEKFNVNIKTYRIIYFNLLKIVNNLHKIGIEHHDIKLENCLISLPNNILYLADFEMASHNFYTSITHASWGTSYYLPPESLSFINQIEFGKKDIWALAVFYCFFILNKCPIKNNEIEEYSSLIMNKKKYPYFIQQCFNWNPSDRPNIIQLIDLFSQQYLL